MVWVAFSKTWKSPFIFIEKNVKINAEYYVANVLKPILLLLNDRYKDKNWTFQQDAQLLIRQKLYKSSAKEIFSQRICGLHALRTLILWTLVFGRYFKKGMRKEASFCGKFKRGLLKEWEKLPQDMLRAASENAMKRMRTVCDANGGHIE